MAGSSTQGVKTVLSMIEGEVEVLEIDPLPQQRVTGSPRPPVSTACAGHPVPLVPRLPAPHPGLA